MGHVHSMFNSAVFFVALLGGCSASRSRDESPEALRPRPRICGKTGCGFEACYSSTAKLTSHYTCITYIYIHNIKQYRCTHKERWDDLQVVSPKSVGLFRRTWGPLRRCSADMEMFCGDTLRESNMASWEIPIARWRCCFFMEKPCV